MASREKKLSTGRKQTSASPVPPKEAVAAPEPLAKLGTTKTEPLQIDDAAPKLTAIKPATPKVTSAKSAATKPTTALAKKITKNVARKALNKTLSMNLKAKNKKPAKIKQQIAKALLNSAKNNLEGKKTALLKNGIKPKRIRKNKAQLEAEKLAKEQDDSPPVLEPILPLEQTTEKKTVKKRVKKLTVADDNTKKIKVENSNSLSSIDETINSILNQIMAEEEQKISKKPRIRKPKVETATDTISETIEDVMNDLSYLIKSEEVKQEIDTVSETSKTEVLKSKKTSVKKPKVDPLKKKAIKNETVENNLEKNITLDASAKHLIDMLDLSVHKSNQLSLPICNRRHSIEKFPIDALDNSDSLHAVSVFNSLPRTVTPKSKRVSKVRQSVDATMCLKRNSPYSTRSDSPAQILRNGKHRKMKETLFEGIDNEYKRRKRLCSDFSGSEKSVSKLSGYESDSSFSDLASFQGTDNIDQKDGIIKPELMKKEIPETLGSTTQNQVQTQDNVNIKSISNKFTNILKRTLSTETSNGIAEDSIRNENFMDSNSNLCNEIKSEVPMASTVNHETSNLEHNDNEFSENIGGNPSSKVPEKSIILDIMKQAFNDINSEDQERRTTRSSSKKSTKSEDETPKNLPVSTSQFYGTSNELKDENEQIIELKDENEQIIIPSEMNNEVIKVDASDVLQENHFITDEEEPPPKLEQMETENNSDNGANPDLTQPKDESGQISPELTDGDTNISDHKTESKSEVEETPENLAIKEDILQALGLQSLKAAEEAKKKGKAVKNDYTGTLKTVIKLNRCEKKKGRYPLKITLQKHKSKVIKDNELDLVEVDEDGHKISKEGASTSWRTHTAQSSDTAGALRKSHYSNRSNMDGSSEHTSDGDTAAADGEDSGKILVIPEKASSFSIHPGRLCKDECSYCFGKFGLFDTPCHIAQMKSVERQDKILETEKHLTRDSCLCDACYRHVDRKSNTPSYLNKGSKRSSIVAPGPRQNHCHVLSCNNIATNILRRKWLIKMRKSVCQVINIDLDNPGLHSIPICSEHYGALEHLMICAMCKRRLARNHIHYLGPETNELNTALNAEGIPAKLMDKPVVCKLCRYFASLVLKPAEERPENTNDFFKAYKRRLLHFHDVEVMDDATAEEPIPVPTKEKMEKEPIKKKKKLHKSQSNNGPPVLEPQVELDKHDQSRMPSDSNSTSKSRSESPSDYMVDYNTLIPSIAMECGSDVESSKREMSTILSSLKKPSRPESIVKEAVEISKTIKLKNSCDNNSKSSASAVQRLGSNPYISVRQLFPGEEELGLQGSIDFGNVKEKTPEGWEKCSTTIQYDTDTKLLWHELQKPYGNQSSFLRHLILLEKYFRSGDLVLSPNASHHSINYSESVQNRLRAYDNIPINSYSSQGNFSVKKSTSGIITTKDVATSLSIINAANIPKNTPITFSQINNFAPSVVNKTRNPGVPPGLISLHPRPAAPPLIKVPQPQKIKIPLTKNWRPNLIPIDPNKKSDKRPGYVKVISAGKPYHITVDDYNRMCAIKKSYDLKQKRLLEAQAMNNTTPPTSVSQSSSILKSISPRKGLTISKTATITSPKSDHSLSDGIETECSLEKLDRTVENLESKLAESTSMLILPKIPKSLTVIPQTVTHKQSRPSSPSLMITPKPKPSTSKS